MPTTQPVRERADRCPGLTRPWPADDGALVRVRLLGGRLSTGQLRELARLSTQHGDGDLHLTTRANVQIRGIADVGEPLVGAVEAAGLLPSRSHELVRNVMVSPLTGRADGLADVRSVATGLDALLLGDADCAGLPGRFLFVLDDGRGDVIEHDSDLAVRAVDASMVQVRAGETWGPLVPLAEAADTLHSLARAFLDARGDGPTAPWHVAELDDPLVEQQEPLACGTTGPPALGSLVQDDGRRAEHVDVPDGVLTSALAEQVLDAAADEVVVTPWRSLLLVDLEDR